ncbi:GTPase IMAP family member 9-like [Centropristis striata]|uniref:GTPase IMAP family member 9-like n=1 Tax=Centropristis striata TaxID=184440 RepID=UPI0027DED293|nr:GTPase IMAP family member 9-like [Centropristis striata]
MAQRQTENSGSQTESNQNTDFDPNEEMRLVLIGKTGNGKSSTGNTILDREAFASVLSPHSVTSECEKARGTVDGRRVAIIDTPGIYDTKYKEAEVVRKLKECISLSAPGPHAFLIVIKLDRFTQEEQKTVELLQQVFGDKAADYTLVIFTHGDRLGRTSIEDFFRKSQPLTHLIERCNRRYHVLSNTCSDNTRSTHNTQVSELLAKIQRMISHNGGKFYTNQMFAEAERAIQEQQEKILRASAEQKLKEEAELRKMFEGELLEEKLKNLEKEYHRKSREKAEKKNKYIQTGLIITTAEVGIAIGAAAGTAGGPLFIGLGAVVGGAVGAVMGVAAPAAIIALKNKCAVQ